MNSLTYFAILVVYYSAPSACDFVVPHVVDIVYFVYTRRQSIYLPVPVRELFPQLSCMIERFL